MRRSHFSTQQRVVLWVGLTAVIVLGVLAPPRRTGDAAEFYAMSFALSALRPPALTAVETAEFKSWLLAQPAASRFPGASVALEQPPLIAAGRQDFPHFWFYSLLAAPFVRLAGAVGAHPGFGFLTINGLLLGFALWQVQRRFHPVIALILLASPIAWFVDKAQTEIFTFSLLCVALAEARHGSYHRAAFAAAVASTQNLPILGAVVCFWAVGSLRWHRRRRRMHVMGDAAPTVRPGDLGLIVATLFVALLHPAYYYWRFGVPTPLRLTHAYTPGLPSPRIGWAILTDPDLGLLSWIPVTLAVAAVGLIGLLPWRVSPRSAPWDDLRWATVAGLTCSLIFLVAFTQNTDNVNNGGTVHVSRYALWLIPPLLPALEAARRSRQTVGTTVLFALGLALLPLYVGYFRPSRLEEYVSPSPQSQLLDAWLPGFYLQIPEIFYERRRHVDGELPGSAASPDCTVILVGAPPPTSACPLSATERRRTIGLLEGGWQAVWVVRPGRLGLGRSGVFGAIPAAERSVAERIPERIDLSGAGSRNVAADHHRDQLIWGRPPWWSV